jgi:hypothetical protein
MAEPLTFANYDVTQHGLDGIYSIGATPEGPSGVVSEMAAVFDYDLTDVPTADNLGPLIGRIGPAKKLQENIGLVQETLGTTQDGITIARDWVERSGLLIPVERSLIAVDQDIAGTIDVAIITGGMRNWMARRSDRLAELKQTREIGIVFLAGGTRVMGENEGPDVTEGMTEGDYLANVVTGRLAEHGIPSTGMKVDSSVGDEVAEIAARKVGELVDLENARVAVVSNAGAWVLTAGQFRRATRRTVDEHFDDDGSQLLAVSDGFPLGMGGEPALTHQNPYTALGQIVRNAQELVREVQDE